MAWYDIGTVSVTNGSATVTGSGTNFIAGAQIGEAFYGPDERLYEIQAVVSATVLTLGSPYLGSTQTGQAYYIIPTQSLVASLASQVSTLISDFQSVADQAGEGKFDDGTAALPGITFNLDQDTGFSRPAANQIGFSTAGVQRALLSSTALTLNVPISGTTGSFSGDVSITDKIVHTGDTNTAIRFPANDTVTVETNGTERMRIDSAGNVGIGTSSPTTLLQVAAPAGTGSQDIFRVSSAAGGSFQIRCDDLAAANPSWTLFTNASEPMAFAVAATEVMRIMPNGRVGIGTSSPDVDLHLAANLPSFEIQATGADAGRQTTRISNDAGNIRFSTRTSTGGFVSNDYLIDKDNSGATAHTWRISNTERMRIDSNGNVGIGTSSPSEKLSVTGNVTISGSLSKGSGSFKIDHPVKPDTHHLVHSFIEGPQADNLYRGKVSLIDGIATVNLDEAGRMTEGTFVALNGNVQCFTANEAGWTQVRGKVEGNILTIEAQDTACTDEVSWLVIGERHDQHMIDTNWTDAQGRIITEPEKLIDIELETNND